MHKPKKQVRIKDELYEKLKIKAEIENRSTAKMLEEILKKFL